MPQAPIHNLQQSLKVALKTSISKLQFVQEKKTAIAKQQRRVLADLLKQGKESSATIKVENIIRDDIYVELLEYLELYCELLLARLLLITDVKRTVCDESLKEAVESIIFSASHAELKEILAVKDLLIHKYGIEFGKEAVENTQNVVPEKIVKRCIFQPPTETLKRLYLSEIAKTYKAPYSYLEEEAEKEDEKDKDNNDDDGDDDSPSGGVKVAIAADPLTTSTGTTKPTTSSKKSAQDEFDALKARFAALKGT